MSNNASIITENSITIFIDGKIHTIHANNINYQDIKARVNARNFNDLEKLLNPMKVIEERTKGAIYDKKGTLYFKEDEIPDS